VEDEEREGLNKIDAWLRQKKVRGGGGSATSSARPPLEGSGTARAWFELGIQRRRMVRSQTHILSTFVRRLAVPALSQAAADKSIADAESRSLEKAGLEESARRRRAEVRRGTPVGANLWLGTAD
jgi:hypothetical protein